jgi:hypothetical protein
MDKQFEELTDNLKRRAEKIGLYMQNAFIATHGAEMDEEMEAKLTDSDAIKARMETGEVRVAIMALFTVGDVAFSDRVQRPEDFDMDTQFRQIMPTEAEMKADEIREQLRQNKGKLFDFGVDDEG